MITFHKFLPIFCFSLVFQFTCSLTNPRRNRIPVLQYHDDWVCINKPPGITVHRSNSTPKHQAVLTSTVKRQLARKVFPVHRLDHRTSGALLFAFDSKTAGSLHETAIRGGKKTYIAMVRGIWRHPERTLTIDKALKVRGEMKDAVTKFTLLTSTPIGSGPSEGLASIVLCEPLTGRTHQIRRHAYAMGHPIIGDSEHGDSRVNRWWRQNGHLQRMALHCWRLEFADEMGNHRECVAPLSDELQEAFRRASLWESSIEKEPRLEASFVDITDGSCGRHYRKKKIET